MTILLAPMEGLLDHPLREVLSAVGGVDRCVTEFIRITDQLLPERVFLRVMPELRNGSRTRAGTPVRAQLLGSDPDCLADYAARLAALGAEGIDLNFGCPAAVVNRHRGGAVLLDEPDLLHAIVAAVRRAVPAHLPVSAKMRLGHRDDDGRVRAAQALAAGGACELVVHAPHQAAGLPAAGLLAPGGRHPCRGPGAGDRQWRDLDSGRCAAGARRVRLPRPDAGPGPGGRPGPGAGPAGGRWRAFAARHLGRPCSPACCSSGSWWPCRPRHATAPGA